jgi:hypothetical protein
MNAAAPAPIPVRSRCDPADRPRLDGADTIAFAVCRFIDLQPCVDAMIEQIPARGRGRNLFARRHIFLPSLFLPSSKFGVSTLR